jgi:hypothetical protein
MPRVITPIRNRPMYNLKNPIYEQVQTRLTINYKKIFKCLIIIPIIVCSILFCGIKDTLRYLEFVIVLLGILVITVISIIRY